MGIKLKSLIAEAYAWERRADGSLPTLADAIAMHEANKEPRWQDSDGDGKWYEPEDVNEDKDTNRGDDVAREIVAAARRKMKSLSDDEIESFRRHIASAFDLSMG